MTDDSQAREGTEGGAAARPEELEDRLDDIVESGSVDTTDIPGPPSVELQPGGTVDQMPTEDALAEGRSGADAGEE